MSAPLSNRLADLAERAGEAARAYRRGSIEAIRQYLAAGAILAEARAECRRGEWGAVLARSGIEPRTARNMMALARSGLTPEAVTDRGGVRAALESARQPEPEAETVSANEPPAVVQPLGVDPGASAPSPPPATAARRRAERRARGECERCGRAVPEGDGRAQCPRCRALRAAADRRRRRRAALAAELEPRIEAAARAGRGVRLSADDVARLASDRAARTDADFKRRLDAMRPASGTAPASG